MNARQRLHMDMQPKLAPTLAVKAGTAAAALDISVGSFNTLVAEGKMPKPVTIPGHSGLILYDFEAVRNAWEALKEAGSGGERNEWDEP